MPSGYKFTNSSGDFLLTGNYELFLFSLSDYKRRIGKEKRYGKDGCVITGDQQADSRTLTIVYPVVSGNDTDFLNIVNVLLDFFNTQFKPFYFVDINNDRRIEVVLDTAGCEAYNDGLTRRIEKYQLEFECPDGHWEQNTENIATSETGGMANNDSIVINIASGVNCFPVFRVSPYESNSSFTIRNTTTGQAFALGSTSFVVGTTFEIDCIEGTIYLEVLGNRVESSASLEAGSGFIFLTKGDNEIQYESAFGSIDLEVTYRERYAF